MILAACRDIRPGRKAADDLLSVPTPWVGHPVLCSLCGESRQTREEARPFSVAALSSGPVPLSSGSHQVAQSLRRSRAHLVALGRAQGGRIIGYHFASNVRDCLERNATRAGWQRVPDVAIYVA